MSSSFTYGDHEYILVTTPMTWIEAKNYATSQGGHLAIIDSGEENKAIFSAVTSAISSAPSAPDGGGASYVWLGASDIGNEAHWTWVDGTQLSYTNWGSGPFGTEPDNFGGNQNAMGLGLQPWPYPNGGIGQPGQWNDISENNRLFFLVEIDHLPSSSTNPIVTAQDIQKIYIAYFGRPADPEGLAYWLQKVNEAGGDLSIMAAGFSSSQESQMLYASQNNVDLVTAIYKNVLGRAPDPQGLQWYADQLDKKLIDPGTLSIRVADGVQGQDVTTLQQRIAAAQAFTQALSDGGKAADYVGGTVTAAAREWIYGIGPDKADLDAAKSALSTLVSSFDHGKVQGKALDGYVKGATVFIDSNGNGQLDTGEISVKTDDSGKFVLPANAPNGTLILEGGTDIATGQANPLILKAAVGSPVVSPITTLVQQMVASGAVDSVENAHDQLFASLGIPQVALSVFDPIQAALNGDATTKAAAVTLEAKTVQIANVLSVAAAALEGAGVSADKAQAAVLQSLASTITQGTVDLTKADTIQTVLQGAITSAVPANQQATLTQAAADVAKVVAATNELAQKAATAYTAGTVTDAVTALSDVFKVATLVQTDIAPKVQEAAPTGNVQTIVNSYTGSQLTTQLASVTPGQIAPDVPANEGSQVSDHAVTNKAPTAINIPTGSFASGTQNDDVFSIASMGPITITGGGGNDIVNLIGNYPHKVILSGIYSLNASDAGDTIIIISTNPINITLGGGTDTVVVLMGEGTSWQVEGNSVIDKGSSKVLDSGDVLSLSNVLSINEFTVGQDKIDLHDSALTGTGSVSIDNGNLEIGNGRYALFYLDSNGNVLANSTGAAETFIVYDGDPGESVFTKIIKVGAVVSAEDLILSAGGNPISLIFDLPEPMVFI